MMWSGALRPPGRQETRRYRSHAAATVVPVAVEVLASAVVASMA